MTPPPRSPPDSPGRGGVAFRSFHAIIVPPLPVALIAGSGRFFLRVVLQTILTGALFMRSAFAHGGEVHLEEGIPQGLALLAEWTLDPVFLVVVAVSLLYLRGWWRTLRRGRSSPRGRGFSLLRPMAHLGGVGVIALALLSPIDFLADYSFTFHMVQHELLVMIGIPLLLLGAPFLPVVRGLPGPVRRGMFIPFAQNSWVRRFFLFVTRPQVAFALFIFLFMVWHYPGLYNAALRTEWLHYLEHACFVFGAGLFWWNIITPYPFPSRLNFLMRMVILFASTIPNGALAATLSFSRELIYAYGASGEFWGMTAIEDQQIGGIFMWALGGTGRLAAMTIVFIVYASREEKKEPRFAQLAQGAAS